MVEESYRQIKKKVEEDVIAARWLEPKVVYGYFRAHGEGTDVVVYDPSQWSDGSCRDGRIRPSNSSEAWRDLKGHGFSRAVQGPNQDGALAPETRPRELLRFTFPRQKEGRRLCISDFFAAPSSRKMNVLGLSLVTIGPKASVQPQRLFEA